MNKVQAQTVTAVKVSSLTFATTLTSLIAAYFLVT